MCSSFTVSHYSQREGSDNILNSSSLEVYEKLEMMTAMRKKKRAMKMR